jgi:Predicted membrane protein
MADMPPPPQTTGQAGHHETVAEHLSHEQQEKLLHSVMNRQAALSVRVSLVFLAIIFGLPLVNWLLPDVANALAPGGFTWTWLLLAILFYPITTVLSAYFIRASDRIETELAQEGKAMVQAAQQESGRGA